MLSTQENAKLLAGPVIGRLQHNYLCRSSTGYKCELQRLPASTNREDDSSKQFPGGCSSEASHPKVNAATGADAQPRSDPTGSLVNRHKVRVLQR